MALTYKKISELDNLSPEAIDDATKLITTIGVNKLNKNLPIKDFVEDSLTSTSKYKALSAKKGKELADSLDNKLDSNNPVSTGSFIHSVNGDRVLDIDGDTGNIILNDDAGNTFAKTQSTSDNSTKLATTAFVKNVVAQSGGGGSTPVIDNLTTQSSTSALSAKQGYVLDSIKFNIGEITDQNVYVYELQKSGVYYITSTTPINGEFEFKLENVYADFQGGIYQTLTSKTGRVYRRFFAFDEASTTPFFAEKRTVISAATNKPTNSIDGDIWVDESSATKFMILNGEYVEI